MKEKGMTIDYRLHYEQVFGNVFERRESECCGVLMKYPRKVKGEQVITLQMSQQLKTKTLMLYHDNYFENSESDSYDKNDIKEKVVTLHKAIQEK